MAKPKTNNNGNKPKKVCPLTAEEFLSSAKTLNLSLGGTPVSAVPRQFSTGSFGWGLTGKVGMMVGDTLVPCQVVLNLVCVGSKPGE